MFKDGSENEKLFAKLVPVSLKDVYTNQSRNSHLFLTMEWQDASSGMYNKKVLVISLTDNNDPFFLYNLHLSEDDFQMLKSSQELLIDFKSFPQHLIDFIEKCLIEEKNPQPKYLLAFTVNEKLGNVAASSQFDIIQTNEFKHLTHLSLKFIAATESVVKQYLATCFRRLKEEKRQLQNNLAFLEQDLKDKLAACQHTLNSKVQELELLRKEVNVELSMKDSKHAQELQEERDRLLRIHKEELERFERERKEKDSNFWKDIQQLQSRVKDLDSLNKELQDKICALESTIRELKSKKLSLEDERKRLKETLQSYKQNNEHLHSETRDQQSRIRQLNEVINDLRQELQNKEQSVSRLKEQIDDDKELQKSLEAELEDINFKYDMNEKTRKALESDKERLNDIIVNLQDKLKESSKEEKSKSQLTLKYKKIVEEKEKALFDAKKEIAELNISLQAKIAEARSLTDSIISLERKNADLEKEYKTQGNVIKFLNGQLTKHKIVPQYVPLPDSVWSPSNVAQQQLAKISSSSPETSPPVVATRNTAPKSVRRKLTKPTLASGDFLRKGLRK